MASVSASVVACASAGRRAPGPPGRPRLRCMRVGGGMVRCSCAGRCVSCFRVGCRLLCGCFCVLLFWPLLCICSRFRFRVLMWFVARPASCIYAVLCAVSVPPPTTHSCAYASLGWYTLYSIPGMHLWVLDHVKSKSTNTPTNIPANTKGAALPRAGGRGAQVQI